MLELSDWPQQAHCSGQAGLERGTTRPHAMGGALDRVRDSMGLAMRSAHPLHLQLLGDVHVLGDDTTVCAVANAIGHQKVLVSLFQTALACVLSEVL